MPISNTPACDAYAGASTLMPRSSTFSKPSTV